MAVLLGGIKRSFKVGDKFEGNVYARYEHSYQLFHKNKSYLINDKNMEVVKVFDKPIDAIEYRDSDDKYLNYRVHWGKHKV